MQDYHSIDLNLIVVVQVVVLQFLNLIQFLLIVVVMLLIVVFDYQDLLVDLQDKLIKWLSTNHYKD